MNGVISSQQPIEICWKIDQFVFNFHHFGSDIESPVFIFKNEEWSIRCYLPYAVRCPPFYVTVISKSYQDKEKFQINIRLHGENGCCLLNGHAMRVYPNHYKWTVPFKDYSLMREKISNEEEITIFCTFYDKQHSSKTPNASKHIQGKHMRNISSQTTIIESLETLSTDLEHLLAAGHHSDVKFRVGSQEFTAHKSVLAARSPVLESMFSHEMLEKSSGVVNIIDCDERVFKDFLVFLYSGRLDHIPSENIAALYAIAEKYDLPPLRLECSKRLAIEISIELFFDALNVAVTYEERDLMATATDFFINNAETILKTNQWKTFIKRHTELGTDLILKSMKTGI